MNDSILVGVLGPRGSYTEQAALEYFRECSVRDDYLSPQAVIEDVSKLVLDYGVVPVENSIQGGVSSTIDALVRYRVSVIGEVIIPIHHVLACHPGAGGFKRVVSHEQALNQCRDYLRAEHPQCVLEPAASTSNAAKHAQDDSLVICGEHAARTYGLEIVARGIALTNNNVTRFFVVGSEEAGPTGCDKTSLVFGLKDRPGALFDSLKVFKEHGINLTRIESRPTKKRLGDYLFIIDFEGHKSDRIVKKALKELADSTIFIKVLGSYPKNLKNKKGVSDA